MPTHYQFTLPLPPTLNHTYGIAPRRGLYKKQAALDWEEEVRWEMKRVKRGHEPLQKAVEVSITLYLKHDRDIDGSHKLLLDSFQAVGIFKNDKQVEALHTFKCKDRANPRLEVTVTQID